MSKKPDSDLSPHANRLIRSTRIAHLATADSSGCPHVVPICFAFDGQYFYSPIDEKPKRTNQLKRLKNIAVNASVALVIDRYVEDWRQLAYLLISGKARVLLSGVKHQRAVKLLRRKYSQYRNMAIDKRPMIRVTPEHFAFWSSKQH